MSNAYAPVGAPPSYSNELFDTTPRAEGDNVPDDFKYDTNVAACELPIRHMFLRKVYALLTVQLFATVLIGAVIYTNETVRQFALTHMWPFWVSMVGSFGFLIGAMVCSRKYPVNLALLGGFTLCESYLVGVCTTRYDSTIVIQAVFITLFIFLGLTIFAFQTKYDFSSWQGVLSWSLFGLIGTGFVLMFVPHTSTTQIIYSGIAALIFCAYILYDTQQIMKRYHPEEEVAATISLYLDIINLFLHILQILGATQSRD
ncbi:hypothetical protein BABINDRAFT_7058 [Babjeviella inositovora NRRL Y-12698]|uniref:Uncharacterized protein n=1 Tax=Babjeviella inositovora NRRL Y-12698 TaxID=984486 RepID=A0A1E3QUK4_9ASCO|nr:uncharacterized protein BABINDRAFT_7058 [Babjeviella inositovora NRRL Y-12698]ODQ81244.1 hypothetical protein BABINDRAFT_7058 [Babjeviella inositovora NRRL Y-12698]